MVISDGKSREAVAGPLAAQIGELAGPDHPHIEAPAAVSRRSAATDDFARGLGFLLDGIGARAAALESEPA